MKAIYISGMPENSTEPRAGMADKDSSAINM